MHASSDNLDPDPGRADDGDDAEMDFGDLDELIDSSPVAEAQADEEAVAAALP